MEYVKPFLAGSFGAAAALRAAVTVLADIGAASLIEAAGIAQLSMFGVIGGSMVVGAAFAWRSVKHPFSRAKKA